MIRIRTLLLALFTASFVVAPAAAAAPAWRDVTGNTNSNLTAVATVRGGATEPLRTVWAGPTADDPNASKALYVRDVLASGALGPVRTLATSTSAGSFAAPAVARNPVDGSIWVFTAIADQFEGKLIAAQSIDGLATLGPWVAISNDNSAYASFGFGAAFAADGTAYQTWKATFKRTLALDPGEDDLTAAPGISSNLVGCCVYWPNVAVESGTNKPYVAYFSNATDRSGIELVDVTAGTTTYVPGSASPGRNSSENGDTTTQLVSRIGAPGVYVGYCGVGPFCKQVLVWKVGAAKPVVVATGTDIEDITLSPAPGGRLWVTWRDGKYLYTRRSNVAATVWGAPLGRALPKADVAVYRAASNASAGYLDAFAHINVGSGYSTQTTRFLPGITAAAKSVVKRGTVLTVKVTDAGVPVAGATVRLRGKVAKTNAAGIAKVLVVGAKGKGTVTVVRAGYTPTLALVKITS